MVTTSPVFLVSAQIIWAWDRVSIFHYCFSSWWLKINFFSKITLLYRTKTFLFLNWGVIPHAQINLECLVNPLASCHVFLITLRACFLVYPGASNLKRRNIPTVLVCLYELVTLRRERLKIRSSHTCNGFSCLKVFICESFQSVSATTMVPEAWEQFWLCSDSGSY